MTDNEYRRLILSARAAVLFPALWSGVTGGIVGVTAASIAWAADLPEPGEIGSIAGTSTAMISWGVAMLWWLRQWRRVRDVPPPTPAPLPRSTPRASVRAEYYADETKRTMLIDHITTATNDQVRQAARLVVQNRKISSTDIARIFKGNRADADAFRDELVMLGYLAWKGDSPQQGLMVTKKGWAILPLFATGADQNVQAGVLTRAHTEDDHD